MCNCEIGYTGEMSLFLDNYEQVITEEVKVANSMLKMGLSSLKKPISEKEFIDGRRGFVGRYNFCHWCGKKIDWKDINKKV